MAKILRAYGSPGNHIGKWNWCYDWEPVGTHGMVCDSHTGNCGCERSFTGITSQKSTTHAIVAMISEREAAALADVVEEEYARAWGGDRRIGRKAREEFINLSELLGAAHDAGTILTITKTRTHDILTVDGYAR
jgi:hypothetical protein